MLADELVASDSMGYPESQMRRIQDRVRSAQKFTLDPAFAAAADALSGDYGSLVKAFRFCRLPFRETWIEVAQAHRPQFNAAEVHSPQFQVKPRRVGFLCSATRDDLSAWRCHLFWAMDSGTNAAGMAMNFDMTQALSDYDPSDDLALKPLSQRNPQLFPNTTTEHPGWTSAKSGVRVALLRHTEPSLPDYGIPLLPLSVDQKLTKQIYATLTDLAQSDWAGETSFVLAVIGLLNARNVVEREAISCKKINKSRIHQGKYPLFDHHVLKIHRLQMHRANVQQAASKTGAHDSLRMHICSGHWKVRKTGIYFWRPFWRGNPERGIVTKDYEVVS